MQWSWLLLLLPVASLSGYLLGRRGGERSSGEKVDALSKQYFIGLNHLLNEEQDQAIAMFERIADSDVDRFETQLALGSLFRRRGELERAIRLHQDLAIKPQLSTEQRCTALLELGNDFVRAGLLDRAESLFDELLQMDAESVEALRQLQKIYEQEQDWPRAIDAARKRQALSKENLGHDIAHFLCELALRANAQTPADRIAHRNYLAEALRADPDSVRVALLRAEARLADLTQLEADAHAAVQAADSAQRQAMLAEVSSILLPVFEDHPNFIPEALPHVRAFAELDHTAALALLEIGRKNERGVSALLAYAELIHGTQPEHAATLLRERLGVRGPNRASLRVLKTWLRLTQPATHAQSAELRPPAPDSTHQLLRDALEDLGTPNLTHRCAQCGFGTVQQHWHCPSCRNWGTTKPLPVT